VFHRASLMPTMFALCATTMGVAAYLNSRIVERLGMRRISHTALLAYIAFTGLHSIIALLGLEQLWIFVAFQSATMACFALTTSNFGAMAMEPVAAVAGIGASLQGFASTLGGALGWRASYSFSWRRRAGCLGAIIRPARRRRPRAHRWKGRGRTSESKCPNPSRKPHRRSRRTCLPR
jgi:MFS family permease